jgi:hypothetical protein
LPKISSVEKNTKHQLNPRNPDYYVAEDLDDLKSKLSYMAPPKDVFGLAKSFRSNKPLYMPMVVKDGDTYKTISGRTRMGVAFLMDYSVKAIVIDKARLMNLVVLPIQRHKYLNSGSLFIKSHSTKQKILDYIDGIISKKELLEDNELSLLDEDKLKFETDMAKRYSFRPQTKNNPMKKQESKLLASAPDLDNIKKLIAQYWYNKPENIILTPIDESRWSILLIGDMGNREIKTNIVELKKGRYRFLRLLETKSNPRKGPREYGTRGGEKLNLSQALEIRANDYRTKNAQHDYDPESVDQRIYELQNRSASKKQVREMRRFDDYGDFYAQIENLSKKLNFFSVSKGDLLFLHFRPNYQDINSGEDWQHVYDFEDIVVKSLGGAVLAINPDQQSGTIRVEYKPPTKFGDKTPSINKSKTLQGYIMWYSEKEGRGIILDENGRETYFDSSVIKSKLPDDKKKLRVIFEPNLSIKDVRCAKNVRLDPTFNFKIKVKWQVYKSLIGHYVYLELPDFPFYNVKLMEDKKQFIVESGTGRKTDNIKYFSNLPDAIDYAEEEFLKLCSQDENYIVSIASGM